MAIRIENKITFIHIPKNAGTSISRHIMKNYKYQISSKQHDAYKKIPILWKDNVFVVIRNPFDRLVSLFEHDKKTFFKKRKNHSLINWSYQECLKGFNHWVQHHRNTRFFKTNNGVRRKFAWGDQKQIKFFPLSNINVTVIRFENLIDDLNNLFLKNKLKVFSNLPKDNVSVANKNYKDYYDNKSKTIVENIFKDELEFFNYSF